MKTLILDNYDSFTFNLYQYVGELGGDPVVIRNDKINIDGVRDLEPTHIIIGPGPGNPYTPRDIGISEELIEYAVSAHIPLLGVCLGLQVLGKHFGGNVVRAPELFHGTASRVKFLQPRSLLFEGLPDTIEGMRYHSLCVEAKGLPSVLRVTAETEKGVIMGLEHKDHLLFGIQFHPESIGTPEGKHILEKFLSLTAKSRDTGCLILGKAPAAPKSGMLVSRSGNNQRTTITLPNGCVINEENTLTVIAGPCSVESEMQMDETASMVKEEGVRILRGGAFKPRTGPYCFQGLGEEGLKLLQRTAEKYGLATISEAMSPEQVDLVEEYCNIIQIGARNMQNYDLLRRVGRSSKPVLLKRGLAATLEEFLLAAEHILSVGNGQVILCERGIRTFEQDVRFTLSLGSLPPLRERTHLPIFVDPSHPAGVARWVPSYSRAAIAMGCDGLIIETHHRPEEALSDAAQSLNRDQLHHCMEDIRAIAQAMHLRVT
ncbi:MAG: 3-deoxy-7-phosphoheptulonate synthase [Candidatus Peregrinibacteria bacterium]